MFYTKHDWRKVGFLITYVILLIWTICQVCLES